MEIKTSKSSPIHVGLLDPPSLCGRIGMTFAPGKHQSGVTGRWQRDLDTDLQRLRGVYEASVLVCLLEEHEFRALEIEQLPSATVVIHCMGGLGRTGTIAAACLVGLGQSSDAAIKAVRAARPGAIENARQEGFVTGFGAVWREFKRDGSG